MPDYSHVPVLQRQKLHDLRVMLGPVQAAAFIERFKTEVLLRAGELERSTASLSDIGSISHKLVAVAGAVGLDQLSQVSRDLSYAAKQAGHPSEIAALLAETLASAVRAAQTLHDAALT